MNRTITGVVLNNSNELSLGRKKKRMISSFHIEPQFIERLQVKYGHDVIDKIKQSITYDDIT